MLCLHLNTAAPRPSWEDNLTQFCGRAHKTFSDFQVIRWYNCLEEPNVVIEQAPNIIENDLKITHFSPPQKAGFYDIHKSSSGRPDITLDALPMHI